MCGPGEPRPGRRRPRWHPRARDAPPGRDRGRRFRRLPGWWPRRVPGPRVDPLSGRRSARLAKAARRLASQQSAIDLAVAVARRSGPWPGQGREPSAAAATRASCAARMDAGMSSRANTASNTTRRPSDCPSAAFLRASATLGRRRDLQAKQGDSASGRRKPPRGRNNPTPRCRHSRDVARLWRSPRSGSRRC